MPINKEPGRITWRTLLREQGFSVLIPFRKIKAARKTADVANPDAEWQAQQDSLLASRDIRDLRTGLLCVFGFVYMVFVPHYLKGIFKGISEIFSQFLQSIISDPTATQLEWYRIADAIHALFVLGVFCFLPITFRGGSNSACNLFPNMFGVDILWKRQGRYHFKDKRPLLNRFYNCDMTRASDYLMKKGFSRFDIWRISRDIFDDPSGRTAELMASAATLLEERERQQNVQKPALSSEGSLMNSLLSFRISNARDKEPVFRNSVTSNISENQQRVDRSFFRCNRNPD